MWYTLLLIWIKLCKESWAISEFNAETILSPNLPRMSPMRYTPLIGNRHKECYDRGKTGVCMFTWECVNAGGTPMAVCKGGITYGSCCTTPSLVSAMIKVQSNDKGGLKPIQYGTHQCGIASKIFLRKGHIYNGDESKFGEFPWMVSLRKVTSFVPTRHWCGGALLNNQWILTAAHCFKRENPSNIIGRFGDLNFRKENKYFRFVERRMIKKIIHPNYGKGPMKGISYFDIALLKMEKPIRFQPHISPICLPSFQDTITQGEAIVTGWGKLETKALSKTLQKLSVPLIGKEECEKMMSKEGHHIDLTNKLFCAGYNDGYQDACQGDSGGPLQMKAEDGRYFVFGIVSTGIGCAKPNFPGIYLRVSPFLNWILETMSTS